MTCTDRRRRARATALVLGAATTFAGCWLEPPPPPPPFDCTSIDRAAERFPDECGEDAGVALDAGP